jgi:hypothetical protein
MVNLDTKLAEHQASIEAGMPSSARAPRRATNWVGTGWRVLRNVGFCIAVIISLFALGEVVARVGFDPGNVLNPTMVRHPQFGVAVAPNSPGHDRWGFRNAAVPPQVDLVALGDSMTYGTYATRDEAWPSIVGREAKLTVYNAGMGGWGPSQFLCAMKVYGRALKPKVVVVGLYLGDDIRRAATEDYHCDELNPERIDAGRDIVEDDVRVPFGRIRRLLSHHSVLYQTAKLALSASRWFPRIAIGQRDIGWVQVSGRAVAVRIESNDQASPAYPLRTGIDKTIFILAAIAEESARIDAKCYVVLMPSRESLLYELLDEPNAESVARSLEIAWTIEHSAIAEISRAFMGSGLTLLNATSDLRRAAKTGMRLYPVGTDPHFNANGYRVVGSFVAHYLGGGT